MGVKCIDNVARNCYLISMENRTSDSNVSLRIPFLERDLIDQASQVAGMNRSQFMIDVAVREAKKVILEQSSLFVTAEKFDAIIDQLDNPAPPSKALLKTLEQR